jgi:hypothetical protein
MQRFDIRSLNAGYLITTIAAIDKFWLPQTLLAKLAGSKIVVVS